MCGLVGGYRPQGVMLDQTVLAAMRDRMVHRGPDGAGLWQSSDHRCAFGHRRLSIIDLSDAAAQPMSNSAGSVTIVFNGEIYNHQEIRAELLKTGRYQWVTDHSDTEVLLHAYEEWGLGCVDKFYGMFAFAIYDARNPERPVLHLVRDRVGIKPLYITQTAKGEWLFASEIRAFFAHPDVTAKMSKTAFSHYLTFIVAPAPLTMFAGIFKIPAGYCVSIDHHGHAKAKQYWDCKPSLNDTLTPNDLSLREAEEELLRLLRQSVARRMVADVPFGVLLSGGIDSSLNVALMSEQMNRPVTSFSVGYEGYDSFNEFQYARRVAKKFGTDHHETLINSGEAQAFLPELVRLQDEPIADNVCIPLYFLSRLVKQQGTTVVQVGEGADESFLGYWWCADYRDKDRDLYQPACHGAAPSFAARLKRWMLAQMGRTAGGGDQDIINRARSGQELFWGGAACWMGSLRDQLIPNPSAFVEEVSCPIEGILPSEFVGTDSHAVVTHYLSDLKDLADPAILQKITYLEFKNRLPEHLLMRVDKMTMAHSIEARVPFLDHDVVDFARRLPLEYKLDGDMGKKLVKIIAERYLDDDMVYRRKQGFGAPMDHWFGEEEFAKRCKAAVTRSSLVKSGLIDASFFKNLLEKQTQGNAGYGFHVWCVLNAILWHESWIEGNHDCF